MSSQVITTEVLVVGGGTGGTAAAIQAARRGAQTILVSELPWLGGMLTAAGVAAPDGNELQAWQTGLWGAFLQALQQRQPGGLDNAWVSFFTYEPQVGAAIFADWAKALPNLQWIIGKMPRAVLRQGDRILGVQFDDLIVHARITLDGTELGDLLALGEVPHRWGWEDRSQFAEPSAPQSLTDPGDPLHPIVQTYPVQAPTWVVLLRDFGDVGLAPSIAPASDYSPEQFKGAWHGYGSEAFLNYGRLPNHQFMMNWPQQGNDYGHDLQRLVASAAARRAWSEEAIAHSQNFAHFVQSKLGRRYGLAEQAFPQLPGRLGGGALALMPYYRESRRLVGLATITEHDILPIANGTVAALPTNAQGEMSAIAMGNYPNDHHYPDHVMPLAPKSVRWGGRWTGTPFTIPYEALVPATVDGLLACDKNISVSHIANGATRLQPVILGIGQAAGMAAALCLEHDCAPRELPVTALQEALMTDLWAPAAITPLWDNLPGSSQWRSRQQYFQQHPHNYPHLPQELTSLDEDSVKSTQENNRLFKCLATLEKSQQNREYEAYLKFPVNRRLKAVTLNPLVENRLKHLPARCEVILEGYLNWPAGWIRVEEITVADKDSEILRR
ncbi:MAG: FAD-dependent oxidoreductase [Leptolyngbyaceae cyanobacterium]